MSPRPPGAVAARAWCRVDFAGGTLDIWPLSQLHPGARTINVAVDLAVTVQLVPGSRGYVVEQAGRSLEAADVAGLLNRPESALVGLVVELFGLPPLRCEIASGSPRGGGLGASSALTVALIRAAERLSGREPAAGSSVAAIACDLEARLMGLPTGTQDHFGAMLGGALEISYPPGGIVTRTLASVDLGRLGDSLLLAYTGQSHFSAANNWQVVRRRLDGDRETTRLFAGISETAAELVDALGANDLVSVGGLMSREWDLRRRLAPGVATPVIDSLLEGCRDLGAWGGKACGAGGGGSVAVLCPPEMKSVLLQRLAAEGFEVLAARPTPEPLAVW